MLHELLKINMELDKDTDKLLDWYKAHSNDEIFKTEKGDKLAKEIVNVCNSFAALCFAAANVEIEHAMKIANFATP